MSTPVSRPTESCTCLDNCARKIAECRRCAPSRRSGAPARTVRKTRHWCRLNNYVSRFQNPPGTAEKVDEPITVIDRADGGAGLIGAARAVHLAGGNARNPDFRPFSTPNRTIAIIDSYRRAFESLPGRDNLGWDIGGR